MTTIESFTGDVNLRTASAKCFLFHTPRKGGAGVEERHLGIAAKSGQTSSIIRQVSPYPIVTPSVQGYSNEIGGKMVRMTYQVEEGEILKIFVQRRPGADKVPVSACQFLRVREGAALREVEIKLLTDASVNDPFGKVRGRFDLLSLADARALGVSVPAHFERMFGEGSIANTLTFATVAPEKVLVENVIKADGSAITVAQVKRRRTINIHSKK